MKNLIKNMQELVEMLDALDKYAREHEDESTLEDDMALGLAIERAGDLLFGFKTGNFKDDEVMEARAMLEYYGV